MTHADWWYQQSKYVNYKHDRVFEEVSQNGWGASAARYAPLVEACELVSDLLSDFDGFPDVYRAVAAEPFGSSIATMRAALASVQESQA